MRLKSQQRAGFTLIEIMIVVAIIGLLAAVAIPNLTRNIKKARQQACINNLTTMRGAKAQWALENKKADTETPSDAEMFGADKYIEKKPECPAGGTYSLGPVSEKPTCTVPEHVM
jgi:general secretion pathway protein G